MAFTEAQRVKVRLYLGWSARFWQMDSRLEQAMNAVDDKADTLSYCQSLLTSLEAVDTAISGCYTRLKALKVGAIELSGHGELAALRSEGRRFSGRLAATLGVPIRHDVWSGCGPSGFASAVGIVDDTGNLMKQG